MPALTQVLTDLPTPNNFESDIHGTQTANDRIPWDDFRSAINKLQFNKTSLINEPVSAGLESSSGSSTTELADELKMNRESVNINTQTLNKLLEKLTALGHSLDKLDTDVEKEEEEDQANREEDRKDREEAELEHRNPDHSLYEEDATPVTNEKADSTLLGSLLKGLIGAILALETLVHGGDLSKKWAAGIADSIKAAVMAGADSARAEIKAGGRIAAERAARAAQNRAEAAARDATKELVEHGSVSAAKKAALESTREAAKSSAEHAAIIRKAVTKGAIGKLGSVIKHIPVVGKFAKGAATLGRFAPFLGSAVNMASAHDRELQGDEFGARLDRLAAATEATGIGSPIGWVAEGWNFARDTGAFSWAGAEEDKGKKEHSLTYSHINPLKSFLDVDNGEQNLKDSFSLSEFNRTLNPFANKPIDSTVPQANSKIDPHDPEHKRAAEVVGTGLKGNQWAALEFFMKKNWTREQAAAIVGNLIHESNLDPNEHTGDGGTAYGIAQWHSNRQADFRKLYGKSIQGSSFMEQLEFVDWELKHSHKSAGDALKNDRSIEQMTKDVQDHYEGPKPSLAHFESRLAHAKELLNTNIDLSNVFSTPASAATNISKPMPTRSHAPSTNKSSSPNLLSSSGALINPVQGTVNTGSSGVRLSAASPTYKNPLGGANLVHNGSLAQNMAPIIIDNSRTNNVGGGGGSPDGNITGVPAYLPASGYDTSDISKPFGFS